MLKIWPDLPSPSQVKTFFAATGKAIATWQIVESSLYEIYRATTGATRPGAEACAFHAVHTFSTKLTLTDAAVRFTLIEDSALEKEWAKLRDKAKELSGCRNQVAHGSVWTMMQEKKLDQKIHIGPALNDLRHSYKQKQPNHPPDRLTLKQVRAYEKDFQVVALLLHGFSLRIPRPGARPRVPEKA